ALNPLLSITLADLSVSQGYFSLQYALWQENLTFTKQDLGATVALLVTIAFFVMVRIQLGLGTPLDNLWR
ncbi:MAG: polysaccharide biosynthesis protein, partial [Prochlorothrix sp.]